MINLNKYLLSKNGFPSPFIRLEECIINAKTSLAKRRLIRTIIDLSKIYFREL